MWPFKRKEKPLETAFLWQFCRGWFIGNFSPSIYKGDFEVAFHTYALDEVAKKHYHKKAEEINLVVSGACEIEQGGQKYIFNKGDVFLVPRKTAIGFKALKNNTTLVVVKTKSIKGDKYYV